MEENDPKAVCSRVLCGGTSTSAGRGAGECAGATENAGMSEGAQGDAAAASEGEGALRRSLKNRHI